jgi:hypothetical protein
MFFLLLAAVLLAALNEAAWVLYISSVAHMRLGRAMLANSVIVVSGVLMTLLAVHDLVYLFPVLCGHGAGLYACWPLLRRAKL